MKKFFTLATLLVLALTVNAQDTYRKSWDFTKWSATTVANLQAENAKITLVGDGTGYTDNGAKWTDVEKASGNTTYPLSKDGKCFWEVTAQGNATAGTTLMANDAAIAETEGLLFTHTNAKNLAIALDYGDCSSISGAGFGPYKGGSYLWLGGSGKNYFVIPHVAPGTTIKIGLESHKLTDARGVELYIGWGNSGTKLNAPDGSAVTAPTTYQDQEWLVPADAVAAHEDGTVDITVRNTNGCHLYYITVGDGDTPVTEEAKKVAYIFSGDKDEDLAYVMLDNDSRFELTAIDVNDAPALEGLSEYDAVVIAPTVTAADAAKVKPYIAFIPVVNLSADIYQPLGLGAAIETQISELTITDAENPIFEGLSEVAYEGDITAVSLGAYFANDAVLAKAGDAVAIHTHNPGRNAYYYVPSVNMSEDVYSYLIPQTLLAAAKTKRDVAAVGTPSITFTQGDGVSEVTITAANSTAIYYTIDGSTPTTASTRYTSPFSLTQNATVKAFAVGDGYTDSQVAEKEVAIAVQAVAPTASVDRETGKSVVTLTAAEGAEIYFNYTNSVKKDESEKYTQPIELKEPAYITFFTAAGENTLQSESKREFVGINGIDKTNVRWDVIAHMDGSKDEWSTVGSEESRSSKVNYIFGKNAQSMYTDEIEAEIVVKDEQGHPIKSTLNPDQDSVLVVYKKVDLQEVPNVSGDWKVTSYGQVMTWESDGVVTTVGEAGRNPETAADLMPVNGELGATNQFLNFKGKKSGEPYNATIQTVNKYAGPFDIVVYLCNGDKSENYPKIDVEYSTDEQNWTKIDTLTTHKQRFIKRTRLSYEGTDEVFVRLSHVGGGSAGQVFNIYLLNNGEVSQQYNEETLGVENLRAEGAVVRTEVFTLGGARTNNAGRGLQIVRKTYADGSVVTKKVLR